METIPKEIVQKLPLHVLFFILSSGLFVVLSLPFDIFQLDFSKGLRLQNVETFSVDIQNGFAPFINVKYLGADPFPVGLIQIILVSLPVGTGIFLLSGIYSWINGKLKIRENILKICEEYAEKYTKKIREDLKRNERPYDYYKLNQWLRKTHFSERLEFLNSIRLIARGLLYGSETFFLSVLSVFLACLISSGSVFLPSLYWLGISVALTVFFYVMYLSNEPSYSSELARLLDAFARSKPQSSNTLDKES
jgi:hypothetical protein